MAAIGAAGAATFATAFDGDATVTFQWQTDVLKSWSGLEQRVSLLAKPRQSYAFEALLTEEQQRKLLAQLALDGPDGSLFYLGLGYESLPIASATSSTIVCYDLSLCDWAQDDQRVVVVAGAEQVETWITSVSSNTLNVNDDVTAVASIPGAFVMPLMGVRLDPQQSLPRYQKERARWRLMAQAERLRFGADGEPGVGASVTTYDSLPVWDRIVPIDGTRDESLMSGVSLVDLGGKIAAVGNYTNADWSRQLGIVSQSLAEWQWLKKFLDTVKGQWKTFLLRTYRPDLVADGNASSGTLTIDSSAQSYVTSWWPSLAHRRLAIVLDDGSVNYRTVESVSAAGPSEELTLDSSLSGTIERVELLETVRLDADEVAVTFSRGRVFTSRLGAVVVQQ